MADKAIPDISLGGAEQNMSREELAAVTKAVATLSPEDRDLLAAVQESPFRLTTAEQFLEFEKNVDCFVLEPHVRTLEDLGWEYLEEKLTIDLTDDLRAAIDPAPFGRRALEEDRGCFTSRGICSPRTTHGSTTAPRRSRRTASPPSGSGWISLCRLHHQPGQVQRGRPGGRMGEVPHHAGGDAEGV